MEPSQSIRFPGLGLTIDSKTSKEEVAKLIAQYPEVKKAFARLTTINPAPSVKETK